MTKYFYLRFSIKYKDILWNIFTRKHIIVNFYFVKLVTNKVRIPSVSILTYGCVDGRAKEEGTPEVPLFGGGVCANSVREGVQYLPLILEQFSLHQGAPRVLTNTDVPKTIKGQLLGYTTRDNLAHHMSSLILTFLKQ